MAGGIATLTLNPALDVNTRTPRVRPTHKLRCAAPLFEAGGGGINVARVVHALGGAVTAVFPSGGATGATIERLLAAAGVPIAPVAIAGVTRESITVDEEETGAQFRFVLPGPPFAAGDADRLFAALDALSPAPAMLVTSGSLPPGCDPAILGRLADWARARGARLIVDTSGPALAACEGIGAHLIKPSLREVADLLGRPLDGAAAQEAAALALRARGFAELVVISMGDQGALLAGPDGILRVSPHAVPPGGGAVGAGDAMVAGLALALARGETPGAALHFGNAAGAAALMTPPDELVRRADVERLYTGTASCSPAAGALAQNRA